MECVNLEIKKNVVDKLSTNKSVARDWTANTLTKVPRIPHPGASIALPRLNFMSSLSNPCCKIDLVPQKAPRGLAPVTTIPSGLTSIVYPSDDGLPAASK